MKINITNTYKKISSVGIGLTNKCNLNCPHCYSRNLPIESLTLPDIKNILKKLPDLKKVNFGTGESILNPDLKKIITFLDKKGIEMALTSNGTTVCELEEEYLKKFKDIDISIDFPEKKLHDKWRSPGAFKRAISALEKSQKIGVNTSIALCLMNINYKYLPGFRKILDKYKINLRINLYKPQGENDNFSLNYSEFWEAISLLAKNFYLINYSEPILSLITQNKNLNGSPCGNSVRIHPDGKISPCVFLAGFPINTKRFKKLKNYIPAFCKKCRYANRCRGGCLSRRYLKKRVTLPDEFCPFYLKLPQPKIKFKNAKKKDDFIHTNYLCTLIVK